MIFKKQVNLLEKGDNNTWVSLTAFVLTLTSGFEFICQILHVTDVELKDGKWHPTGQEELIKAKNVAICSGTCIVQ